MNNEVLFISSSDTENELFNTDLINSIETKRPKTISIVDAENPEESQLYTYNKFLEIFDSCGFDGFIL